MSERARPWILPAAALALTALGLLGLVFSAASVAGVVGATPLDDAAIHLGMARSLAEHGTWGINPGQHASASSSPLWTLLLAAIFLVFGPQEQAGLALALGSSGLLLWAAAATLRDEGLREPAVGAGLGLLILAVPLPFLVGLSMEHVLHAALALLLLRSAERGGAAQVFLLAGAAAMTRYETAFLAGALGLVLARERTRVAAASVAGAALSIVGFGLFNLSQGGLFLPNSVALKAVAGRDWWASLGAGVAEGAPLLTLSVAVSLGALAADTGPLHRRRAAAFALTVLAQIALGRMGWFFRYEGWLIAWGSLLLISPARLLLDRARAPLIPLALLLATPLLWRAGEALRLFAPGARMNQDVDVTLARWVAAEWPDATIAAHDLGALSFLTDATLVDVIGLGTDEVARLRLKGQLDPARVDALLQAEGVDLAITGRDWLGAEKPASFVEIASLWAPFPQGPGEFETVIWSVNPASRPRLEAALDALDHARSTRTRLERVGEQALNLDLAQLSGAAVQREPERLAFYTNGEARLSLPRGGELILSLYGDEAEGRGPRVSLSLAGRVQELLVGPTPSRVSLGPARAGEELLIRYEDDVIDAEGADRNLFVGAIRLRP